MSSMKTRGYWARIAAIPAVAAAFFMLNASAAPGSGEGAAPYLRDFPSFAPRLAPDLPGDVDMALKARLEKAEAFNQVQREFDLWSWQTFLALNWPTDDGGHALPGIGANGAPRWSLWHTSPSIFQVDGARPTACGQSAKGPALRASRDLSKPISRGLSPFSAKAQADSDPRLTRHLGVVSAVGELHAENLDEITQAFSGPLVDQNREFVFYEMLIDPNEVGFLCSNSFYNINGQVAFKGSKMEFPEGTSQAEGSGSTELKLAWKVLTPKKDDFSRFLTSVAWIKDPQPDGTSKDRKVTVGLVGMHIGHKTKSSPQWIWSTFEHVDNLDVDSLAHPTLKPSFRDPNCDLCAVNQQPAPMGKSYARTPVQVWRAIPIPAEKMSLNAQAQAALGQLGSVLQYYQLIDTQWPTQPLTKPSPWNGALPDAVANKAGGHPTPVYLTNVTMETYFQGDGSHGNAVNQPACNGTENPDKTVCPPPAQPSARRAGGKRQGAGAIGTPVMMTESCTGCHSSAGYYTSYDPATGKSTLSSDNNQQQTADFSWLLQKKASWDFSAPPSPPAPRAPKRR